MPSRQLSERSACAWAISLFLTWVLVIRRKAGQNISRPARFLFSPETWRHIVHWTPPPRERFPLHAYSRAAERCTLPAGGEIHAKTRQVGHPHNHDRYSALAV